MCHQLAWRIDKPVHIPFIDYPTLSLHNCEQSQHLIQMWTQTHLSGFLCEVSCNSYVNLVLFTLSWTMSWLGERDVYLVVNNKWQIQTFDDVLFLTVAGWKSGVMCCSALREAWRSIGPSLLELHQAILYISVSLSWHENWHILRLNKTWHYNVLCSNI